MAKLAMFKGKVKKWLNQFFDMVSLAMVKLAF
jgi:hypothetical protein